MPVDADISPFALPGMLGAIAAATSVDVAVALARRHGGRRLYLPREPKRGHPLCRLVGTQAARIICARWGGKRYELPAARSYLHWYDARRLRRQGKSYSEIAASLAISHQQARRLLDDFSEECGDAAGAGLQAAPSACPICGHRHRAKPAAAVDRRQLTLPLGG